MGQFSWITQDTGESIRNNVSGYKAKAYMHDDKGNVWEEKDYEGYGEFGGKDFYQLLAEMNNVDGLTGDVDEDRLIGIRLAHGTSAIKNKITGELYKANGIDFFNWQRDILPMGLCANDCLKLPEWEPINIKEENIKYPNLTRNKDWVWINEEPQDCPNQGWQDVDYEDDY